MGSDITQGTSSTATLKKLNEMIEFYTNRPDAAQFTNELSRLTGVRDKINRLINERVTAKTLLDTTTQPEIVPETGLSPEEQAQYDALTQLLMGMNQ